MGNRAARRSNREFWSSAIKNNAVSAHYVDRLTELSISMFNWQGLPSTVDPRFLELVLLQAGQILFFKEPEIGAYVVMRVNPNGPFDIYQIPRSRRPYASNGYVPREAFTEHNSVIIFNNMLHTPSQRDIRIFAHDLADIDRAIAVNVNAQKTPILIRASDTQRLTLENLYMQYDGNQPFIFGTKELDLDSITVLNTQAPFVAKELYDLKTDKWNEALTYLGISNVNIDKKERLVRDEVNRSLGGAIASRYSRLESRRQACDQINRMFPDLHVTCDFREDYNASTALDEMQPALNQDLEGRDSLE